MHKYTSLYKIQNKYLKSSKIRIFLYPTRFGYKEMIEQDKLKSEND
jgi:hypothetical protein